MVIGPYEYGTDSGIDGYSWIGASAHEYGELLTGDPMWGPGSCRVLEPAELQTADGVMAALQEVADQTEPDDVLLVVYVGHGAYWSDLPGGQVHFSVGSSQKDKPWTWLSSWYIYRTMRGSRANLKVLIADCCYANLLPQLSEKSAIPEILGRLDRGTCVLTATTDAHLMDAKGCSNLPGRFPGCTPFSGHLMNVLSNGTTDYESQLTLGMVRDALRDEMQNCQDAVHDMPKMLLNNAREREPLFTNHMDPERRNDAPVMPVGPEDWAHRLRRDSRLSLSFLLRDPGTAGDVVAHLYQTTDEANRDIARNIHDAANNNYTPDEFARYWNRVEPTLRA
ncbi:hypothetical protein [Actinophytocola sp.]|uniref:hypothetical protein n=1 Tax=Actinophytocola sp. TaxID=1872138 RepID=UPI002D58D47F|nr:hypothetical protein [Actinophytocola sp.]HYQ68045.1 hypothetical protein [Actinophytocola sp.]